MRVQRLYKNLIRQSAVNVVDEAIQTPTMHDLSKPNEFPSGEELQDSDLFPEKDFFRPKKVEGEKEQSAILALLPTPDAAKEIADSVSDFEVDPDDLHITLVYIGKKLSEEEAEKLVEAITPLCESYDSLECRLQGLGLFDHENKDGNKPFYASVDAIGMAEFRSDLIQAMDEAGIEYAKDYDFIPHMTLAYTDPEKISLAEGSPGVEWSSNTVYLLNGEDKIEIEFGGEGLDKQASVSNIIRFTRLPQEVAEAIYKIAPRGADLALAKSFKAWCLPESKPLTEQSLNDFLSISPFPNISNYVQLLKEKPKLIPIINKLPNNVDIGDIWNIVDEVIAKDTKSSLTAKDAVITFPDGFYWIPVSGEECQLEGTMMQHCGQGDNMFSLRDKKNRPHVTIDLNKNNEIAQVKGKQNEPPNQKYWNYIKEFVTKFNVIDSLEVDSPELAEFLDFGSINDIADRKYEQFKLYWLRVQPTVAASTFANKEDLRSMVYDLEDFWNKVVYGYSSADPKVKEIEQAIKIVQQKLTEVQFGIKDPRQAGGFGFNLDELNTPSKGNGFNDNPADNHQTENLSEDPDLKLGDKEEQDDKQSFYLKQLDTVNGVDIWIVDGTEIRNQIDPDYVFGGHHYRYDWIPENEIWIDDDLGKDELDYTIQHELEERQLMVSEDMDYETAHDHALETEKEMRDQDKEGDVQDDTDVEAPYSSGNGPMNVRFDEDKHYTILKGAMNYLGQEQDIMITPEFKKMIKRMLDLGFDLSTRDKAIEILAFNAKGFDKIIDRLTDPQYDEIYTTLVTPEIPVNKELPPDDPNEVDPSTFDDEYSYNVSSPYEINPTLVDRNDADRLVQKISPKTKISMKLIIAQELASEAAINLLSTLFDLGFTVWNYRDAQIILSNLPTNSAASELMAIPEVSWSTVIDAAMPQAQPQPSQQPQDQAPSLRNKQLNLSLEEANEKFFPRPKYPTDMQQTDIPEQSVSPVQEAPQELTYATPLSISDPSKVRALNKQPLMQELANQYPSIIKKLPDEINVTSWGDSLKVPIRDKDGRTGPGKGRIANGGMFVRNNISKQEGMVVGASSEGLLYVITFPDTQLVQWDPKATDIRESHNQVKEVGMGEKEGVALPEGNPVDENKYQDYGRLDNSIPRPIENEDILYR